MNQSQSVSPPNTERTPLAAKISPTRTSITRLITRPLPSLPAPQRVEHRTAAHVWTGAAQVSQDVRVAAAGLLQGVGQDSEAGVVQVPAGQRALLVGGLGQLGDGTVFPRQPRRINQHTAEGVADDTAE